MIDSKQGIYGIKISFPSRTNYFFFSQKLKAENIESALRKAQRQLREAKDIENANSKGKALPKRFRVNNVLVNATIEYQTKLRDLSEKKACAWSDNSIYGALLIGYLAHLIRSLIRYDKPELKNFSTKFIKM